MQHKYASILLLWFMWPATGLMITSAITAVLLKWRSIVESFRHLQVQAPFGAKRRCVDENRNHRQPVADRGAGLCGEHTIST